jgi:predicted transcriptional regulator of viral defense system
MSKQQVRKEPDSVRRAVVSFRANGGMLRMTEALHAGIHRNTLSVMLKTGTIERLSRGLYRLTDVLPLGNPDLVTVAQKAPQSVICLISALAYHELTTQIPHEVYIAISRNSEPPRLDYPPVRVFRISGKAFSEGIENQSVDGVKVRIYSREKTLADSFKYRKKIGLDTVLEAIRLYKQSRRTNIETLMRYAEICRVTKVMRPYLEAVL